MPTSARVEESCEWCQPKGLRYLCLQLVTFDKTRTGLAPTQPHPCGRGALSAPGDFTVRPSQKPW
jgi:hypothetical protein